MKWADIQETIQTYRQCQRLEGGFFAPFRGRWPEISLSFRDSGYFLLQSFPRPLKGSVGNVKIDDLKRLMRHPVETHLKDQITFFSPSAILALGKPASVSISILFPDSSFAHTFESGDFSAVQGKDVSGANLATPFGYMPPFRKRTILATLLGRPYTRVRQSGSINMSIDLVRAQTPEEKELVRKLAELTVLQGELAQRELDLVTLSTAPRMV